MIVHPSLQYNTTVALFIKPNNICIYHQDYIKLAGRVCIDCTVRRSVMNNNNRRDDRYVMINPFHLKPVLKPMYSCIERTRDPIRSRGIWSKVCCNSHQEYHSSS
jgi:hypothetical protein